MKNSFRVDWLSHLKQGLKDDGFPWDWTSHGSLSRGNKSVKALTITKENIVWAASGLCRAIEQMSAELGSKIKIRMKAKDGESIKKGTNLCEWIGDADLILALERPFLNLASYANGIATKTNKLVRLVERRRRKNPPRISSTRKILPGYQDIAIHSILAGGGFSHRLGLSGGVLIKENHIRTASGIENAVAGTRAIAPHGLKIQIEVKNKEELMKAVSCGVDAVLLDNFSPARVRSAMKVLENMKLNVVVEVSGGLNEKNIDQFVLPGVNVLSVGSLTHSVKASDLTMLIR